MKILFVPHHFYLNMPLFEKTAAALVARGNEPIFIDFSKSVDPVYDETYFNTKQFSFERVLLDERVSDELLPVRKISNLLSSYGNQCKIIDYVKSKSPDVVVVGSDLGDRNVRFLINACDLLNIPVVVLYSCQIPPVDQGQCRGRFSKSARSTWWDLYRNFWRAVFFTGDIVGSYAPHATIGVMAEHLQERLLAQGIAPSNIRLFAGHFAHDQAQELLVKNEVCRQLGIRSDQKIIVFFTECIEIVYGLEYAKDCYQELKGIFNALGDDVTVIVKFHPLETPASRDFISALFSGEKFQVVNAFDVEKLLVVADLSIAHFSKVLMTAASMGKRFLSLNIKGDRKRTFVLSDEAQILEIGSMEGAKARITLALRDASDQEKIEETLVGIASRFSSSKALKAEDIIEKATL